MLEDARRRGITTSLDINFDPYWSLGASDEIARRKGQVREILGLVDLAHGNVRELCHFTDCNDLPTALGRLTAWGVKAVVVHLGNQGAGYYSRGAWFTEPPDLAARRLNSTGTGDVLSVCMILLHGRAELTVQRKLQLSNRVVREFIEGQRTLIPVL